MGNNLAHLADVGKASAANDDDDHIHLRANRDELRSFVDVIFRNCVGIDGFVSLRAFEHERNIAIVHRWTPFDETLVPTASETATTVANRPFERRAVFSPPVCLFGNDGVAEGKRVASEANVVCAPVIAVELDERPDASLEALTAALGRPTLVVASGGQWRDPTDVVEVFEAQEKLHLYWRLAAPATTVEDRAALRRARALAARLVAADATAIPLMHPMRWPGSWHTKGRPARLCRIVGGDPQRDVVLQEATAALEAALSAAGLDAGGVAAIERGERLGFKTKQEWSASRLQDAARLIPNDGLSWDRWNRLGMAFFDASHGCVDGLDAFHAWSEKDPRYDIDATDARWSHWHRSPPSNLSAGTLLHEIRKVDPTYEARIDVGSVFDPLALRDDASSETAAASSARFAFEGFDDLAGGAISQQSRPLIKGLLDQGAMTVLYGESNSGKTFVALDMAFHIATGRPWNAMRVTEASVVYVAAEGGQGFAKRVAALRQRYGSPPVGQFHALRSAVNLLRVDADLVPLVEAIRSLPARPGLVVFDTLSRIMAGGDENASTDMGALVRNLDALRSALGCHLMVVHHTGKNRSKGARGHSLLRAATDTEIEIADGQIVATKQRDIERNAAASFTLEPVVIGIDLEGDPVTSAVVRIDPPAPAAAEPAVEESAEDAELRQRIGLAAYRALDGASSASVRAIQLRLIAELVAAGVRVGSSLPMLREKIEWGLAAGVTIEADGQTVRMEAAKASSGKNAPWTISAYRVPGEAHGADVAEPETVEDAEGGEVENDGK